MSASMFAAAMLLCAIVCVAPLMEISERGTERDHLRLRHFVRALASDASGEVYVKEADAASHPSAASAVEKVLGAGAALLGDRAAPAPAPMVNLAAVGRRTLVSGTDRSAHALHKSGMDVLTLTPTSTSLEEQRLDEELQIVERRIACFGANPDAHVFDFRNINRTAYVQGMLPYREARLRADEIRQRKRLLRAAAGAAARDTSRAEVDTSAAAAPGATAGDDAGSADHGAAGGTSHAQPGARRTTPARMPGCARLVVSISTIPSRVASLGSVLRSMRWQQYAPDQVILGVPPFAYRKQQLYDLPPQLLIDDFVRVVPLPADFGPVSKLLAALLVESDPSTCIITVDDDGEPPEHVFRHLVSWAAALPGAAVGFNGWNTTCITHSPPLPFTCPFVQDTFVFVRQTSDNMCVSENVILYGEANCYAPVTTSPRAADVLMGVSTPLYRRGMFLDDFFDIPAFVAYRMLRKLLRAAPVVNDSGSNATAARTHELTRVRELAHAAAESIALPYAVAAQLSRVAPPDVIFYVDDVYISAYLANRGIPRIVVPEKDISALPGGLLPEKRVPFRLVLPLPSPGAPLASVTDSLHAEAAFHIANAAATSYFGMRGWWNT